MTLVTLLLAWYFVIAFFVLVRFVFANAFNRKSVLQWAVAIAAACTWPVGIIGAIYAKDFRRN